MGLLLDRKLIPDAGAYLLSGQTVSTLLGRKVVPEGGSYIVTGSDITLDYSGAEKALIAESGIYALTGKAVDLVYLPAVAGETFIPTFRRRRR